MFQIADEDKARSIIVDVLKVTGVEYLYRYDDHGNYMSAGETTETFPRSALYNENESAVILNKYRITSKTPRGCWIYLPHSYPNYERFVMTGTKKCFARPTKEKALEDYMYRKRYQVRKLEGQAKRARERLDIAIELSLKPSEEMSND